MFCLACRPDTCVFRLLRPGPRRIRLHTRASPRYARHGRKSLRVQPLNPPAFWLFALVDRHRPQRTDPRSLLVFAVTPPVCPACRHAGTRCGPRRGAPGVRPARMARGACPGEWEPDPDRWHPDHAGSSPDRDSSLPRWMQSGHPPGYAGGQHDGSKAAGAVAPCDGRISPEDAPASLSGTALGTSPSSHAVSLRRAGSERASAGRGRCSACGDPH